MTVNNSRLGDICEIKTGYPMSRLKAASKDGVGKPTRVLMPSAMAQDYIVDEGLATETLADVKDDFFTHTGDIVVKLSTPFNSVYIDKEHEGILVTSFALIVRPKDGIEVDMRYIAAFLESDQAKRIIQEMGTGSVMPMLKKGLVAEIRVPLIPLDNQRVVAQLFDNTKKRKSAYRKLISLSDLLLESEFSRRVFDSNIDLKG